MYATQEHQPATCEFPGDGHVGRQHEFLDHLVTLVVNRLLDRLDPSLAIQLNPHLRQMQFQRAGVEPTTP